MSSPSRKVSAGDYVLGSEILNTPRPVVSRFLKFGDCKVVGALLKHVLYFTVW